jgi:hypothetical protein
MCQWRGCLAKHARRAVTLCKPFATCTLPHITTKTTIERVNLRHSKGQLTLVEPETQKLCGKPRAQATICDSTRQYSATCYICCSHPCSHSQCLNCAAHTNAAIHNVSIFSQPFVPTTSTSGLTLEQLTSSCWAIDNCLTVKACFTNTRATGHETSRVPFNNPAGW